MDNTTIESQYQKVHFEIAF